MPSEWLYRAGWKFSEQLKTRATASSVSGFPFACKILIIFSYFSEKLCMCVLFLYVQENFLVRKSLSVLFKSLISGLPWWHSGWESACQCRGRGFEPWSGKIPHATEQLGPWATITEPARLEPVLCNKRGRNSERPVHRNEEWPPLATTRESRCTEMKTQHNHK